MQINYINERDWELTRNCESLRIDRHRWLVNQSVILFRSDWYAAMERYANRLAFNLLIKRIKHLIRNSI